MPYPHRSVVTATGITFVDITDEWVLETKPRHIRLTPDKTTIAAADPPVDKATITIQLTTPRLIDDSYQDISEAANIILSIEDVPTNITLDANGSATLEIFSVMAKTIIVTGISHPPIADVAITAV